MRDLIEDLKARDLIANVTDAEGLIARAAAGPMSVYAGFDATAKSLHVGHLVVIRTLLRMKQAGFEVIGLIGEGTSLVGDPSFRTSERPMIDEAAVLANAAPIVETLSGFFGPDAIVSNASWLAETRVLDFLTDTGRHFTISRMLSFESVKTRLGEGLTFLEFAYMLLQAKDFLVLHDRHACALQVGGSDQWANILCGVDLIRRERNAPAFGLTTPLLTRSDGRKMGKSDGKAVWLRPEMTTDFDFWQFWRNTPDADVAKFLRIFTDLPIEECDHLGRADKVAGKILLANEVTAFVRGEDAARAAQSAADAAFGGAGDLSGLPKVQVSAEGVPAFRALVLSGAVDSAKAAKRVFVDGIQVDGVKITEASALVMPGQVIGFGKRRFLLEEA